MRRAATALIALALALAGCGGGGGGPSKADYIARADRICQSTKTQVAPLVAQLAAAASGSVSSSQARELAGVVDRLHAAGVSFLARLGRLEQPSGDHGQIESFLSPSRQVVDDLGKAAAALRAGNVTGALGLLQAGTPMAGEANSAAQAYGFKQCVSVLPSGA